MFTWEESSAIKLAADKLDTIQVDKAIDLLVSCFKNKSKVIITGVGKSGIVARKIAANFIYRFKSLYLSPRCSSWRFRNCC